MARCTRIHTNMKTSFVIALVGFFIIEAAIAADLGLSSRDVDSKEKSPDPVDLLNNIAQARQRIVSGEMEFEVGQSHSKRPLDGTNQLLLKVVFDGSKRRFESSRREFAYVLMGPHAGTVTDAKRLELGLNREASVSAGGQLTGRPTALPPFTLTKTTQHQPTQYKTILTT